MANNTRLGWPYALKPRHRTLPNVPHDFMVVGDFSYDDMTGTVPPEVTRETVDIPFGGMTAATYKPANGRIVVGTSTPSRHLAYTDTLGSSWSVINVLGFSGTINRLFYVASFDMFFALTEQGSSTPLLYSHDGKIWIQSAVTDITGNHFGFAVSDAEIVVSFDGTGSNTMRSTDGENWTSYNSGHSQGLSLVWHPNTDQFMGFLDGTNEYYTSSDGIVWTGPNTGPDIVGGAYVAAEANVDRILVFGSTINCSYSDDDGVTWNTAPGFDTNTGELNRYVAISGDTIYVALIVAANLGYLSMDNGATWQAAYHLSGAVEGIAVVV